MRLRDFLSPDSVLVGLEKASKEQVIRRLVDLLPLEGGADEVLQAVLEREKVMSTGIGRGVAIPHAKTDHVPGLMAAVAIAEEAIPFEAIDGKPVRIFFLIVSNPRTTNPHIRALSQISRLLNDNRHKAALENAKSVEDVLAALEAAEVENEARE
jgi:mannitol/fructose-specific phosphotransferase system IIA component (Ntr-type)